MFAIFGAHNNTQPMRKKLLRAASLLAPGLMTRIAYHQMTHPRHHGMRAKEQAVLQQATQTTSQFGSFRIQHYHWEGSGKKVLLIHGWEGQAGNFSDLIGRLREKGYDVYAFDAPAHGQSSRGKTSMFAFSDLCTEIVARIQPDIAITHSFGSVAIVTAMTRIPDWTLGTCVMLTTPDRFRERIEWVAATNGVSDTVTRRLIRRIEKESGVVVDEMSVGAAVSGIAVGKALILHDVRDRVIPISQPRRVHQQWPGCQLDELTDTGHFKILHARQSLDRVLAFLPNPSPQ